MARAIRGTVVVALLALSVGAGPVLAAPIPSKAGAAADLSRAQRAQVEELLARDEVARVLASRGFDAREVEQRLAQLSAEDLSSLATHLDQIQAAGQVPNYIWVLLAILMGVTIIATVF